MARAIVTPALDEPALASFRRLLRRYQAGLPHELRVDDLELELATLAQRYPWPSAALLLARAGDADAGCVVANPLDASTLEVRRLYVEPAFRGSGTARMLMEALTAFARERAHRRLVLDTEREILRPAYELTSSSVSRSVRRTPRRPTPIRRTWSSRWSKTSRRPDSGPGRGRTHTAREARASPRRPSRGVPQYGVPPAIAFVKSCHSSRHERSGPGKVPLVHRRNAALRIAFRDDQAARCRNCLRALRRTASRPCRKLQMKRDSSTASTTYAAWRRSRFRSAAVRTRCLRAARWATPTSRDTRTLRPENRRTSSSNQNVHALVRKLAAAGQRRIAAPFFFITRTPTVAVSRANRDEIAEAPPAKSSRASRSAG